jgi:hypothetical protein
VNWFSDNRPAQPIPVIVEIETSGTDYRFTDFDEEELYGWPGDYEMTGVTVTVMADTREEEFSRPVLSRLHLSTPEEMTWAPKVGTDAVSGLVITVGHERGTTRKLALGAGELPLISIGAEGVRVGRQLVGWENGEWEDDWDSGDDIEVYWRGKPVGGPHVIGIHEWRAALGPLADCIPAEVNLALYMAMTDLPEWRRELIFGLLQELDYLIHHGDTSPFASSPEAFIFVMTTDPERILHLALTLPWEWARHIRGPASLMLWLEENHPESHDRQSGQSSSGDASDNDESDQNLQWLPSKFQILCAMRAARTAGSMTSEDVERMDLGPPETWPADLWSLLGFSPPAPGPPTVQTSAEAIGGLGFSDRPAETINVRVEIASQGTFHHITRDYYTYPRDGEEFVCFEKIQVSIYDTQAAVEGQERLLRTVTFRQADGTLGVHGKPPEPPWRGTIDEVGCSSRMERELTLAARGDTPVNLDARGITIGDHTITWPEVTENGGLDCYYSVTAYGHGIPLDGRLTERLYHGDEMRVGPKRAILAALIDQIDYIVANSPSERYGRSPVRALDAAADNPNELIELVNAMPWERARNILGPSEFANWLEENHPASPRRPLPPPPKTPPDTDEETPEWPPDNTPLTPRGEVALNALLISLKTQGMLTDEFLPASEGEILLNQPFTEWPPELQEKMAPYGAGPAIR